MEQHHQRSIADLRDVQPHARLDLDPRMLHVPRRGVQPCLVTPEKSVRGAHVTRYYLSPKRKEC
jgi:hypothetical protein